MRKLIFTLVVLILLGVNLCFAQSKEGKLYLVSVGVGDPDNITLKAYKIIKEADVIFLQ